MNSQVMAPVSTAGTAVAVGQRVCVSGAGPLGWTGRVITARPGWLAVRKDNGGRDIVDLTRRTVLPCVDADADA
jgi:hypothetical protein